MEPIAFTIICRHGDEEHNYNCVGSIGRDGAPNIPHTIMVDLMNFCDEFAPKGKCKINALLAIETSECLSHEWIGLVEAIGVG